MAEIQSPIAKRLFVLAKLSHLAHLRMAEYEVLTAAADLAGHHGVGVLLETCLADKLAFAERNRRLIQHCKGNTINRTYAVTFKLIKRWSLAGPPD